jgi:anti-sigma28 factor (negative regulator of flagellin synthesis)
MKIDQQNLNGVAAPQTGRTQETPAPDSSVSGSGAQTSGSPGSDRAEISTLAGRISQTLASQSAERTARIQELAKQYSTGRYSTDSKATGSALVQDTLEGSNGA